MNRSLIPITLAVSLEPSTTTHQLQEQSGVLSVGPVDEMTLKAKGGTGDVTVTFSPEARIPRFQEEVKTTIHIHVCLLDLIPT